MSDDMKKKINEEELDQVSGGFATVKDEDILKEMKLPGFNLNSSGPEGLKLESGDH